MLSTFLVNCLGFDIRYGLIPSKGTDNKLRMRTNILNLVENQNIWKCWCYLKQRLVMPFSRLAALKKYFYVHSIICRIYFSFDFFFQFCSKLESTWPCHLILEHVVWSTWAGSHPNQLSETSNGLGQFFHPLIKYIFCSSRMNH